jgi:GDP-L-fucose synthase
MARVLITGGSGFVGSNLVRLMSLAGYEVAAVPRGVDLRDRDRARSALRECGNVDYILHAADVGGDAKWASEHPATQFLSNSLMALNLLEAWRDLQPGARFVGFSSLWAYPESVVDVVEESYWNGRMHGPTEHYGLTKKALGVGIQAMRREHGLRGTMLVLGNVYGPGDPSSRVIPSLIRRLRAKPPVLEVWGDASATRDFVYIDDQVAGILRHIDYDGELLNVTTGVHSSLRELVTLLTRLMAYEGDVVFSAGKGLGVANRRVDVAKATAFSGWPGDFPLHTLEAGLKKTLQSEVGEQ